jgi:hypothetical protein
MKTREQIITDWSGDMEGNEYYFSSAEGARDFLERFLKEIDAARKPAKRARAKKSRRSPTGGER